MLSVAKLINDSGLIKKDAHKALRLKLLRVSV